MQLKLETDYAIRILVYLAKTKHKVSAKELATILNIPLSGVPKIARKLCQKGWLTSQTGTTGGYTLQKNPKEITLLDVFQLMESNTKINRCLKANILCVCNSKGTCAIHQVYEEYQKIMEWHFTSIRIIDLVTPKVIKERYDEKIRKSNIEDIIEKKD